MDKKKIREILLKKEVNKKCCRCGSAKFSIADGVYEKKSISKEDNQIYIINVIYVCCENCGAITEHSIDILKAEEKL